IDKPNLLLGEANKFKDYISIDTAKKSNNNNIKSFTGTDFIDKLYTNTSNLNKDSRRPVTAAKNMFKIKYISGSFRIKSLEIFQWRYIIDYRRKASRSKVANPRDKYFPIFYLDIISIIS
ncbi:hypothetical protein EDB80DRAFT_586976, partial [Ilyonectria destructans]